MRTWLGTAIATMALATPPAVAQTVQMPGGFVPRQAVSYGSVDGPAIAVDDTHPLPVAPRGRAVTYIDRSGAIATGGTAQTVSAANANRSGFFIQNLSSADLWLNSVGAATAGQPSIRIAPGQLYEAPASGVPATALSILGATSGQSFAAREW